MVNQSSTSRSCQKSLISGLNSARVQAALVQAALGSNSTLLPTIGGPSIQAQFDKPTLYTVEFRISNVQDINVPAGNVLQPTSLIGRCTPTATLQWSLGGNTIYRRISVFNGASISGVCEQLVASISDDTILPTTQQVGILINGVLGVNTVATANVAAPSGLAQTINGVALNTDGMAVLLTDQTSAIDNGPYLVHAGGWTHMPPLTAGSNAGGAYMLIVQGTYAGEWYQCVETNTVDDVVGTKGLTFDNLGDPTYQQQYTITIVGGEGTRPATALPPTYQQYVKSASDGLYRFGCVYMPASDQEKIQIPQDVGIKSVMITVGAPNRDGVVTPSNFFAELDYTFSAGAASVGRLSTYFPPDYDFVPIPSQTGDLILNNTSTSSGFDMLATIIWGIDG